MSAWFALLFLPPYFAQAFAGGGGGLSVDLGMKEEDRIYYRRRAEREIELAREARHPNAARAHTQLAGYYSDMVQDDVVRPFRERRPRLNLFARSR